MFYNIKPNLSLITVHNSRSELSIYSNFTSKCLSNTCRICNFINCSFYLKVNGNILPFFDSGNCQSTNLVYIISCFKCSIYYIGETSKSLNERISQHLFNIKKFRPYIDENEVANHFRVDSSNLSLRYSQTISQT